MNNGVVLERKIDLVNRDDQHDLYAPKLTKNVFLKIIILFAVLYYEIVL